MNNIPKKRPYTSADTFEQAGFNTAGRDIYILFFPQTFIKNYLRNVKKSGRRLGRLIN
jgi:hypothetical protein